MPSLIGLVIAHPGVPGGARSARRGHGPALLTVLMTQVVDCSAMLLPYPSAPVMVAIQLANVGLAAASRLSLLLGGRTLLLLPPLACLWWRYLGGRTVTALHQNATELLRRT